MPASAIQQKKPHILLVDDDRFIRKVFQDALEATGYLVTAVADGEAALTCLRNTPRDLVLLDLVLPGKDGFETCRELRTLPSCQLIPVLVITGAGNPDMVKRAFEAGATDFVAKPINPDLLVHRVRYLLRTIDDMRKLAQSTERLANAQRIARLGSWEWDPVSDCFTGSSETLSIMGLPEPSQLQLYLHDFLAAVDARDRDRVALGLEKVPQYADPCGLDFRLRQPDGTTRLVRLQAYLGQGGPFETQLVSGTMQDLTEMQQAEDRVQMLREAIDALPINTGITISDINGKIIYSNVVEAQMHGYLPGELLGKDARILAPQHLERPFPPLDVRGRLWQRESLNVRKNGEVFPVQLSSIAVRNAQGRCIGVVTACEDLTSRKDSEKKIEYLACYDPLTGLPNRVTLLDQLPRALALARRETRDVALLFLDLDNFKDVNDTQGHDFGDKFLKEVAKRLASALRQSDTLVRLGGDEFVVVLTSISTQEGASLAAQRVQALFQTPFLIEGQHFYSSASIGIALYPGDGADAESLLKCADAAMYHAKSEGKSNFQFYSREMNERIMRRVALENSMRQGIAKGEFCLYYQPLWDLRTARMTGVEALLRWESSEFGPVEPGEFIPLAETSGIIFELGEMVLRSAFLQARKWASQGHADLRVAVNISAKQIRQPDFLQMVANLVQETEVEPGSLEFEFTESAVMEKAERNISTLRALRVMGMKVSIDDFGTGYSSLNYLKHFPIDTIKIDRSFVADVSSKTDDAAITEAIISMAHSLKLKVIAEGVENEEQLQFLELHDCDEVQGYYLARPMSARDLGRHLASPERKSPLIRPREDLSRSRPLPLPRPCAFFMKKEPDETESLIGNDVT